MVHVVVWENIWESLLSEAERSVLSLCLATTLILLSTTASSFRADGRSGSCVLGSKEDMVLVHCATKNIERQIINVGLNAMESAAFTLLHLAHLFKPVKNVTPASVYWSFYHKQVNKT